MRTTGITDTAVAGAQPEPEHGFSEDLVSARWEFKLDTRAPPQHSLRLLRDSEDVDGHRRTWLPAGSTTQAGFNATYDAATNRLLIVRNNNTAVFTPSLIETLTRASV